MHEFRIAAAQVPSIRGAIDRNIATHCTAVAAAAQHHVSMLIFPELSLTGYEPDLASELAITSTDSRLDPLRRLACQSRIDVVVGAPLNTESGKPALGAILLSANGTTSTYQKMHLGAGERAVFTPGHSPLLHTVNGHSVGIAICADASQPSHPRSYADAGARIYAAGVFLNDEWYHTDAPRLAGYAQCFGMLVVMANHAASVGALTSVGRSAVWGPDGVLLAQAAATETALVVATNSAAAWSADILAI